jgi:hypothetical protein
MILNKTRFSKKLAGFLLALAFGWAVLFGSGQTALNQAYTNSPTVIVADGGSTGQPTGGG